MKKVHIFIKTTILNVLDFFYPPFQKWIPKHTFKYAACGGLNTLFDIAIFAVSYNFIFKKQLVHIGNVVTLSPHIASFCLAFCISFPTGFYLSRYVVFQHSVLRGRTQLVRYLMVVVACIFLNYFFLKLFVDYFGWYPTPSKIATTVIVVAFSYFFQTYFSFKSKHKKQVTQY
jgi:putative flippase GtrA